MKAPFYRIFIDNDSKRELTEYVDGFKYEDCTEEDDMIEFRISPENAKVFDEDKELITGVNLTFEFGYMGLETSGFRKARITDVSVKYADFISITVRALDKGTVMKKQSSCKVWKDKTTKDIVSEIAQMYGLTPYCEIEGTRWKSLPQGHLSDYEFLQQVAMKEADGDYICFVRDTELRFEKRGVEKKSKRTFTYGDPESKILSFEPKNQESTAKKGGINSTAAGFDAMNKKPVVHSSSRKDGAMLDEYVNVYDANGNKTGTKKVPIQQPEKQQKDATLGTQGLGQTMVMPPMDGKSLGSTAKSQTKAGALNQETASLRIEGDPTIRANEVITMAGVFKKHSGNWYAKKVTHEINSGGYITTYELAKNGRKVGSVKATGKVNKTVGSSKSEPNKTTIPVQKQSVNKYNANAEKV